MRKHILYILACLLLYSCSDSIQEDAKSNTDNAQNKLNINFSLANASTPIAVVTGELISDVHDNIQFTMSIEGDMASYSIEHVQSGQWTLTIKAFDNISQGPDDLRFIGEQTIDVVAGQLTNVGVNLNPTSGALQFTVAWGSAASLLLDISVSGADASVSAYQYLLERVGFNSISGSHEAASEVDGHIMYELHDIQHGIWKLTVTAITAESSPVAVGVTTIELLTGVVAVADISYPINPFSLTINTSYETQSGDADKIYMGDEKLRLYLINEKGFMDLREPYILRTDAESVQFLELHKDNFINFNKSLNAYLNLDALSHFTNLIELEASGWIIKGLDFLNHPALKHVSLREIEADHADFSGAPNMLAIDMYDVSIGWIDVDELLGMELFQIEGGGQGEICCAIEQKEVQIGPTVTFGHNVGSIYVDASMFGKYEDIDEGLFIDSSYDTDSMKVKLPNSDAKRALFAHEFHILKDDYVLKSETDNLLFFSYINGQQAQPRKEILQIGSSFSSYRPLESLEVLQLLPNLWVIILIDQKFTEIDLSVNTSLFALLIEACQFFPELDLSNNLSMGLDPSGGGKTGFSLNKKATSSSYLIVNNNFSLSTITFGNQVNLTEIEITDNKSLTNLDLSTLPNLTGIYGWDNSLTSLDISNQSLSYLDLSNNQLTNIDLSNQANLTDLYLSDNDIKPTLDITEISATLNYVYTTGKNTELDTIFYKTGQDTLNIIHDPQTVLKLLVPAKQKGGN